MQTVTIREGYFLRGRRSPRISCLSKARDLGCTIGASYAEVTWIARILFDDSPGERRKPLQRSYTIQ